MTNLVECPYLSADELGITEAERSGLMRLIPRLLSGEISESDFKMTSWCNRSLSLQPLFGSGGRDYGPPECWKGMSFASATPAQGAVAIANFLTHGK